jgi:two-component system, chemotaxis family, chemotaxis protein CheY
MRASPRKTVLLVDDDATIVEMVGDRLRFEGYRTLEAYSAEEGLRIAARQPVDLIILDIGMPGMNGLTFLNQAKARLKDKPPILVFTARSHLVEDIRQGGGVDAVLIKTAEPSELMAEVRRLLGEKAADGAPRAGQ